jgi:hypothetical protein
MAARIDNFLGGRRATVNEVAAGLGVHNAVRYATATGTVLIRWEGALTPVIWTVPRPEIDPLDARRELARRYLHVYGPTTPQAFAKWAGVGDAAGRATFESLGRELAAVRAPTGDAWILARDEATVREPARPAAPARLLPSRGELWTSRVWPGAVLVAGEIVGTWRRAHADLSIQPWRRLTRAERAAVEAEAESLPLPRLEGKAIVVRWPAV